MCSFEQTTYSSKWASNATSASGYKVTAGCLQDVWGFCLVQGCLLQSLLCWSGFDDICGAKVKSCARLHTETSLHAKVQ